MIPQSETNSIGEWIRLFISHQQCPAEVQSGDSRRAPYKVPPLLLVFEASCQDNNVIFLVFYDLFKL